MVLLGINLEVFFKILCEEMPNGNFIRVVGIWRMSLKDFPKPAQISERMD